jgi:DNA-directed RNA polymerase subunit beta
LGEMEVWALEAHRAAHMLQEMLTIKSDDVVGRAKTFEAIVKGTEIPDPTVTESFRVFLCEVKSLCLDIVPHGEQVIDAVEESVPAAATIASDDDIAAVSDATLVEDGVETTELTAEEELAEASDAEESEEDLPEDLEPAEADLEQVEEGSL